MLLLHGLHSGSSNAHPTHPRILHESRKTCRSEASGGFRVLRERLGLGERRSPFDGSRSLRVETKKRRAGRLRRR